MKLLKALQGDRLGVQLEVPAQWEVEREADEVAHLRWETRGVDLWLFWFPGLELALGQGGDAEMAELSAEMHPYAKAMFEVVFQHRREQLAAGAGAEDEGEGAEEEEGEEEGAEGEEGEGEEKEGEGEEEAGEREGEGGEGGEEAGEREGEEEEAGGEGKKATSAGAGAAGAGAAGAGAAGAGRVAGESGDAAGVDGAVMIKIPVGGAGLREPRTADPTWTPMVDCRRVEVAGAAALWMVHRMAYEPGSEIVMGHLMVPVKGGMFEARVTAGDTMTGLRESMLVSGLLREAEAQGAAAGAAATAAEEEAAAAATAAATEAVEKVKLLAQRDIDDPKHDEAFEAHALSRVRAALRWLMTDAGLKVLAPAPAYEGGEVALSKLECVLVPPRRFVRCAELDDHNLAGFLRVGFCGTDGLERLLVQRADELGKLTAARLRDEAAAHFRGQVEGGGGEATLTVEEATFGGRPCVLLFAEMQSEDGGLRGAACWWLDGRGRAYSATILASDAVPAAVRRRELEAVATSWRSTRDGRPWWKLW